MFNSDTRCQFQKINKLSRCVGQGIDRVVAVPFLLLLLPVFLMNVLTARIKGRRIYHTVRKTDAWGRSIELSCFSSGIYRSCGYWIDIAKGTVSICGVPLDYSFKKSEQKQFLTSYQANAGFISLYGVRKLSGLVEESPLFLMQKQLEQGYLQYVLLILKWFFCHLFYRSSENPLASPKKVKLFGLSINNWQMQDAVNWVVGENPYCISDKGWKFTTSPKVGFFINANSINQLFRVKGFRKELNDSDVLFADGSGIRLAAKSVGTALRSNINGTDMLPLICRSAAQTGKRLFFFGAKPGVAEKAAKNLKQVHSGLNVVGTQHGFVDTTAADRLIETINKSNADILMVALGSPFQERWINQHRTQLQCRTILAVGGLFDYFSGNIPRAPVWMRELGLEWIWRLIQEPVTKFKRYVIGTPEFLFRTYILNQVK